MLKDLLLKNRSYRRFDNSVPVSTHTLTHLVELTTLCASGRNAQPLKYKLVNTPETCAKVYETLTWAGYLTDWDGPVAAERPSAYLIQFIDTDIASSCFCDDGIQAQTILLGAVEQGLGGCIVKAVKESALRETLGYDEHLKLNQVIALGVPVEKVYIESIQNNDYKYWRDADGGHHVPKRGVEELVVK
ncbi:MAG: nitroreductase family protein [Marinifilaceae bacterium]